MKSIHDVLPMAGKGTKLLFNQKRLKILVTLDRHEKAEFMYLCRVIDASRGDISAQIKTLQARGCLTVTKTGIGRDGRTICHITDKGRETLNEFKNFMRTILTAKIPPPEELTE